jgi:hypothetical protein
MSTASPVAPLPNLLLCRPERVFADEMDGERVIVLRPRFLSGPLAWWLQPKLRSPYYRVRLDDIGSFIWQRCDGQTTVEQIAQALDAHFGEQVSSVIERLQLFLRQLEEGSMIRMHLPDEETTSPRIAP